MLQGQEWVELHVKPSPEDDNRTRARGKVQKAWVSLLDEDGAVQVARAPQLDGSGVDAVLIPKDLRRRMEEVHEKSMAHDELVAEISFLSVPERPVSIIDHAIMHLSD